MNLLQNLSIGVCGFSIAGFSFALLYGWVRKRQSTSMVLFSCFSVILAIYTVLNIIRRSTVDIGMASELDQLCDIAAIFVYALVPYILKSVCKLRIRIHDYIFILISGLILIEELMSPASLRWQKITSIIPVDFGIWGTQFVQQGIPSPLGIVSHCFLVLVMLYCILIPLRHRQSHLMSTVLLSLLPLFLATNIFVSLGIELGWWRLPFIGEFLSLFLYVILGFVIFVDEKQFQVEREELLWRVSNQADELQISNQQLLDTNNKLTFEISARIKTETARQEAESRFRALFENAFQLIGLLDSKGILLEVNKTALDMVGLKAEDVCGHSFWECAWWTHDIEMQKQCENAVGEALNNKTVRFESSHLQTGGFKRYLDFSLKPIFDGKGEVALLIAEGRDITERKIAEKALEKSELKYRSIFDNATEGIFQTTKSGNFISANYTLARIFDYDSTEEFLSSIHNIANDIYLSAEDREKLLCKLHETEIVKDYEIGIRKKGTQTGWVSISARVVKNDKGEPIFYEGTIRDITSHKHATEQAEMLKKSIDVLSEGAYWFGVDNKFIYVNDAGCKNLGYTKEELIGKPLSDIAIGMYDENRHWEILRSKGYYQNETIHRKKDGTELPVEIRSSYVKFQGEELCCGFAIDITQRKMAESALRESEERYRRLIESVTGYVYTVELQDGKPVSTHHGDGCFLITGYEPADYDINKDLWINMVHPDDRKSLLTTVENVLCEKKPAIIEHRIFQKNGNQRWISTTLVPHLNNEGKLVSYDGLISDITDRKIAQIALQESESRFRQITENMQEIFFLYEKEGHKLLYISPVIGKIFGVTAEQFSKDRDMIDRAVHHEDLLHVNFLNRDRFYSEPVDDEFRIIRPDGEIRWLRLRSFLIRNAEEEIVRVAGLVSDITEFKNAQEQTRNQQLQLIQADKMASLGLLVSGIGHEINNPTNFITLNTPLLRKAWENILPVLESYKNENGDFSVGGMNFSKFVPNVLPLIDGIANGAKRIQRIVADLKEYARADSNRPAQVLDVNAAARSAISLMDHRMHKSTNNVRIELSPDPLYIRGNLQRIEQVIINLLHNASDAINNDEKAIGIETRADGGFVLIIVYDEGEGIDPKNLSRITDPFFTTKRDTGGTGLGLSVSAGIIKEHGGIMRFESELGKGTTVTVELPQT